MTKEKKQEWAKAVKTRLPDYLLSDTLERVAEYLWPVMIGAECGAYSVDYGTELAKELRGVFEQIEKLKDQAKEAEKQELAAMVRGE